MFSINAGRQFLLELMLDSSIAYTYVCMIKKVHFLNLFKYCFSSLFSTSFRIFQFSFFKPSNEINFYTILKLIYEKFSNTIKP